MGSVGPDAVPQPRPQPVRRADVHRSVQPAQSRSRHTPQGRYWQTAFPGDRVLGCGRRSDEATRAFARVNGPGDLPASPCIPCMEVCVADFATREPRRSE